MQNKNYISSYIAGTGKCVPEKIISNSYFESYLETSDQWITERTGIKERRWTDDNVGITELAQIASEQAIQRSNLEVSAIDGIIFGTVTPDFHLPSAACILQTKLGITRGFAFDVTAACAGFIYSLALADMYIARGVAKNVLVVGGDLVSYLANQQDRNTCVLFGDGVGAVVVRACEKDAEQAGNFKLVDLKSTPGIYASELCADGREADILKIPYGSANRLTPELVAAGGHFVQMDGKAVFKFAVKALVEVTQTICAQVGLKISEIDHFVSHQANQRILQLVGEQLGLDKSKIPMNIEKYGNTSAGTVPVLLDEELEAGRIKRGDLVLFSAIGSGMVWGAVLVRI
ncbi:MAG: ketoacyl-ACP synthase III [Deltaproteobacteria bacterium]|jgi:3-oxoacyl-[acyl-carrier-protein] synthase-3|nr:ketoacyl-ACP synthase III [Deltaproteobacteria bacterium]